MWRSIFVSSLMRNVDLWYYNMQENLFRSRIGSGHYEYAALGPTFWTPLRSTTATGASRPLSPSPAGALEPSFAPPFAVSCLGGRNEVGRLFKCQTDFCPPIPVNCLGRRNEVYAVKCVFVAEIKCWTFVLPIAHLVFSTDEMRCMLLKYQTDLGASDHR